MNASRWRRDPSRYRRTLLLPAGCVLLLLTTHCGPGPGSASNASLDPVGQFIKERMVPASAAFFAPTPMVREQPSQAVLEIGPPSIEPSQLQAELRAELGRKGITVGDGIKVAPRMVAGLTADRDCTITPIDAPDRAIPLGEKIRWRWNVTPRVSGTIQITATLSAPVIVDGKETGYQVTSFSKTVTVDVSYAQHANDVMTWAKTYWPILVAVATGALAIWGWMKKKRPRRAGFTRHDR